MANSEVMAPRLPYILEPECMTKCRSLVHASTALNVITRASEEEVMSYLQWLCSNYAHLMDAHGRTPLHLAASCGKWQVMRWLLHRRSSDCNLRDWESGWTPLHRSLFYGQLCAAKVLLEHGANLFTLDHDRLSPLDLVMKDRPKYLTYRSSGLYEAYVWGINHNYNLGLGIEESKLMPERLDTFRKENISIIQIVMCKFHTMFLSQGGQVYACGHGLGGRLGLSAERTVLTPEPLKSISQEVCTHIACGRDHNLLLMETGSVWTCGSNAHHQLGHVPPVEKVLTPKIISKVFQGHIILGVCAGRFHSVVYSQEAVFTFGLNAGQLGHPAVGEKLQTVPRIVTALSKQQIQFTHVTASDGATVCFTKKGDIYVLHEYQCRKVASKRYDIIKVLASGGCLDTKADASILKEGGGTELKVVFLTDIGELYVWSESCPQLTRCLLSSGRPLHIVDIALFNAGLVFMTNDGEGFTGNFIPRKLQTKKSEENIGQQPSTTFTSKRMVTSFATFLDRDECHHLKIKRLANVHRATAVSCDYKGRNFAVLQAHPKCGLLDIPQLSESEMVLNMRTLLQECDLYDDVHDTILKVGIHQYASHQYVLSMHWEAFSTKIMKQTSSANPDNKNYVILEDINVHPAIMQQILEFLYTGTCKLLTNGVPFSFSDVAGTNSVANLESCQPDLIMSTLRTNTNSTSIGKANSLPSSKSGKKKKSIKKSLHANPVKMLADAALKLNLPALKKRLDGVQFVDGRVVNSNSYSMKKLKFDRMKFPELYNVCIKSENGIEVKCHKCILVARSEYFHSMLASNWIEKRKLSSLTMPNITGDILIIVIDYLYTDEAPKVMISEDVEFVCNILATADRLLLERLKEFCEIRLTDLLTLKNALEVLELSSVFNAPQLKATCMQFILLNLPAVLESTRLASLSDEILCELTKRYRTLIPQMCYRAITPYADGPSLEEIQTIAGMFPVKSEEFTEDGKNVEAKGVLAKEVKKPKIKRRSQVRKISETTDASPEEFKEAFRRRNESTCSIGSDVSGHEYCSMAFTAGLTSKSAPEIHMEKQFVAQCPSIKAQMSSCPTSPPLTPKWLEGDEDLNSAFPDLLNEVKCQPSNVTPGEIKGNRKTPVKLSQKQRKKLASKAASPPLPIPHTLFEEHLAKTGNPWAAAASNDSVTSLKDIMSMEKGLMTLQKKPANISKEKPLPFNTTVVKQPGASSPVEAAEKCANVWSMRQMAPTSPDANIKKDVSKDFSRSSSISLVSANTTPCFSDILRTEQEESYHLSKLGTKPLHIIQLEDQAMEELLKYYEADKNPDERITVQRVLPQYVATPIWKPNKSLDN